MSNKLGRFLNENIGAHLAIRASYLMKCAEVLGWKTAVYGAHPCIFINCMKDDKQIRFSINNTHNMEVESIGYGANIKQSNQDANDILTLLTQTRAVVAETSSNNDNVFDIATAK